MNILVLMMLSAVPHHVGWLDMDADGHRERIVARVMGAYPVTDLQQSVVTYDIRIEVRSCGKIYGVGIIKNVRRVPVIEGYRDWQQVWRTFRREPILLVDERRYVIAFIGQRWRLVEQ